MEVLARIKRLIVRRRYRFAVKALMELDQDGLEPEDALEAVLNAQGIKKTLRSQNPRRGRVAEKLYVIETLTTAGPSSTRKAKSRAKPEKKSTTSSSRRRPPAIPTRLAPVRTCTQCGSRRVGRVGIDLRLRGGTVVTVEIDTCSSCGERYLDPEAIDAIRLARGRERRGK